MYEIESLFNNVSNEISFQIQTQAWLQIKFY